MKNIRRSIKVIGEIAIACLIFFFILTKTPLFERAIPWREDDSNTTLSWSGISGNIVDFTKEKKDITTVSGSFLPQEQFTGVTKIIESNGNITYIYDKNITNKDEERVVKNNTTFLSWYKKWDSNEKVIETPIKIGVWCSTPRWESISHQETVLAYVSDKSTGNNICMGQVRICNNGILWWSYVYKSCSYTIDGKTTLSDGSKIYINSEASNDNQQRVSLDHYIKKRDSIPKKYIQPVIIRDNSAPELQEAKWKPMQNTVPPTEGSILDNLDQITVREITNTTSSSCTTPRWVKISHGKYVYAYNVSQSSYTNQCISQKRACIDGKLSWSFKHKSCTIVASPVKTTITISKNVSNSHIPSRNWPFWNGKSYNISDFEFGTRNYTPSLPTQNFNHNSCTTPRWQVIPHTTSILAYLSPTGSSSNPCQQQVRSCKNGVLDGSFTYKSCQIVYPTSCTTPWNAVMSHWTSVIAYRSLSNSPSSPCEKEIRSCRYGILDGSYTYPYCGSSNVSCTTPWWYTIHHNSSITAYRLPTSTNNSLCDVETRVCRNGILWWSYTYNTCQEKTLTPQPHQYRRQFWN